MRRTEEVGARVFSLREWWTWLCGLIPPAFPTATHLTQHQWVPPYSLHWGAPNSTKWKFSPALHPLGTPLSTPWHCCIRFFCSLRECCVWQAGLQRWLNPSLLISPLPAQHPSDLSTGSFRSPAQTITHREKIILASNLEKLTGSKGQTRFQAQVRSIP